MIQRKQPLPPLLSNLYLLVHRCQMPSSKLLFNLKYLTSVLLNIKSILSWLQSNMALYISLCYFSQSIGFSFLQSNSELPDELFNVFVLFVMLQLVKWMLFPFLPMGVSQDKITHKKDNVVKLLVAFSSLYLVVVNTWLLF